MARKVVTAEQFKSLIADDPNTDVTEVVVVKAFVSDPIRVTEDVAKALDIDPKKIDRAKLMTISDEGRDRDRDRIKVGGWDLANYKKNPVVLFAHNNSQPPVGRSIKVWKDKTGDGARLRAIKQFTDQETNPFGFMIWRLLDENYLKAASVGFIPQKMLRDEEAEQEGFTGYVFEKQELIESSIVPVPSNPRALEGAKSIGIDCTPMIKWAEEILDVEGLDIPLIGRARLEEAYKSIQAARVQVQVPAPIEPVAEPSTEPSTEQKEDSQPTSIEAFVRSLPSGSKVTIEVGGDDELELTINSSPEAAKPKDTNPEGDEGETFSFSADLLATLGNLNN